MLEPSSLKNAAPGDSCNPRPRTVPGFLLLRPHHTPEGCAHSGGNEKGLFSKAFKHDPTPQDMCQMTSPERGERGIPYSCDS